MTFRFNSPMFAVICWLMARPLFAVEPSRQEQLQRQIALTAGHATVQETLKKFAEESQRDPKIMEMLGAEILAKPSEYQTHTAGATVARTFIEEAIKQKLNESVLAALKAKDLKIPPNDVLDSLAKYNQQCESAIRQQLNRHSTAHYEDARRIAVAKQRETIDLKLGIPDQASIEQKLDQWRTYRPQLVQELAAQALPKGGVVFEENTELARDAAQKVADRVDLEYRNQLKVADDWSSNQSVPDALLTAEAVLGFANTKLDSYVQNTERQGIPSYRVFKAVRQRAEQRAAQLESDRLTAYLATSQISVTADMLSAGILADLPSHRTQTSSRDRFTELLADDVAKRLAQEYAARAEAPSPQKLANYFATRLAEDRFSAVIRRKLATALEKALPPVREGIARKQLDQHFGRLVGWRPSEQQIVSQHDDPVRHSVRTYADGIAALNVTAPGTILLGETEDLLRKDVAGRIDAGVKDLQVQLTLVREIERARAGEVTRAVLSGTTKKELIAAWEANFNDLWGKAPHVTDLGVFQRARDEIKKAISLHFDEFREAMIRTISLIAPSDEQDGQKPSGPSQSNDRKSGRVKPVARVEPGSSIPGGSQPQALTPGSDGLGQHGGSGGSGSGDGKSSGGSGKGDGNGPGDRHQGDIKADVELTFSDVDAATSVAVVVQGPRRFQLSFATSDIDESVRRVAEKSLPTLWDVWSEKSNISVVTPDSGKPNVLRFHLRNQSTHTRYLMALKLRSVLETAVEQWNHGQPAQRKVEFSWSDGQ